MKYSYIVILFVFGNLFSQNKASLDSIHKNEIRVNVLKFVTNRIEITYERFLTDIFSVGVTSISQEDKFRKSRYEKTAKMEFINEFQINPFFRYSESNNKTDNIYVEAFSSINGGRYKTLQRSVDQSYAYYSVVEKEYLKLALGASIGCKFYIYKRIAVDTYIGVAGNLKKKNSISDIPEAIARIGINFGYKF